MRKIQLWTFTVWYLSQEDYDLILALKVLLQLNNKYHLNIPSVHFAKWKTALSDGPQASPWRIFYLET